MRFKSGHLLIGVGLVAICAGCNRGPKATYRAFTELYAPYRFDDQLAAAKVSASAASSSALMADPVVWHNFDSESDITWNLLRGRIGFRQGDLMVKGEGSTPVIQAPGKPQIDWSRYEAVEIRMLAEGGSEIKIKIGNDEFREKIASLRQYHDYRFVLHFDDPGARPFLIMPTDGHFDLAAIRSIALLPRKADFPEAAGRELIGKQDEYRNAMYVHSPATVTFEAAIPKGARLRFGTGIMENGSAVKFRVTADGNEVYSATVTDRDKWTDADVDLVSFGGMRVKLTFETSSDRQGTVALWANPLLTSRAPRRPNVLIYMIDTLRADHASAYGYSRDTTPFLKRLGAEGVVFEDCVVQATWTKPSTASLLTSLYSFTHGIVNDFDTIPKGAATMAERLHNAGYVTAGIIANPFAGRLSGLQRGFDYLDEWPVIQRYRKDAEDRGTDSAAVNKIVFPWLEQHGDEPFFLYVHTTDPHAPYRPPAGFEEKFANPAETAEFNRNYSRLVSKKEYGGGAVVNRAGCARAGVNPDRFIRQAVDRYDGEILHNDSSLGQLIGKLKQLGVLEGTLVIVVSDHGEEFWEHGWTAHGQSLYQELSHGVFVMWNPRLIPAPRRVTEPVQLIDVMPTVLDLVGIKIPDIVQGQNLAPLVRGQAFQRRGEVMTSRFASPHAKGFVPENGTDTVGVVEANWALLYRDKGKEVGLNKVELYDRRADRGETRNVANGHPQEVDRMMTEVGKWMQAEKVIRSSLVQGPKATMDAKTLEQLRSLGYLGGAKQ